MISIAALLILTTNVQNPLGFAIEKQEALEWPAIESGFSSASVLREAAPKRELATGREVLTSKDFDSKSEAERSLELFISKLEEGLRISEEFRQGRFIGATSKERDSELLGREEYFQSIQVETKRFGGYKEGSLRILSSSIQAIFSEAESARYKWELQFKWEYWTDVSYVTYEYDWPRSKFKAQESDIRNSYQISKDLLNRFDRDDRLLAAVSNEFVMALRAVVPLYYNPDLKNSMAGKVIAILVGASPEGVVRGQAKKISLDFPDSPTTAFYATVAGIHLYRSSGMEKLEKSLELLAEAKKEWLKAMGHEYVALEMSEEELKLLDAFKYKNNLLATWNDILKR